MENLSWKGFERNSPECTPLYARLKAESAPLFYSLLKTKHLPGPAVPGEGGRDTFRRIGIESGWGSWVLVNCFLSLHKNSLGETFRACSRSLYFLHLSGETREDFFFSPHGMGIFSSKWIPFNTPTMFCCMIVILIWSGSQHYNETPEAGYLKWKLLMWLLVLEMQNWGNTSGHHLPAGNARQQCRTPYRKDKKHTHVLICGLFSSSCKATWTPH